MVATEFAAPFTSSAIATALQFRKRNRPAIPDCVDALWGSTALKVSVAGGGASVDVQNGRAVVQGALYELTGGPKNLAVSANGGGSNRTDYAVLSYDDTHTPGIYSRVLAGTALTQDESGVWDMPLATWQKTPAGAITGLVDLRPFRGSPVRPCTSATRPSNPTLGEIDYEVDTGRSIRWNGATWDVIWDDSGDVALSAASGWASSGSLVGRRVGAVVDVELNLSRTGAGVSESVESKLTTLPTSLRPLGRNRYFPVVLTSDNAGRVDVQPDGNVVLRQLFATAATGAEIRLTLSYLQ